MSTSIFFIMTVIFAKQLVMATGQCSDYQFQFPFYPGDSCEEIYDKNPESHQLSGYYWIFHDEGPRKVFCGMNYTGSSCEDIYNNNPETGEKSGYYRINNTIWTYCNMTAISTRSAIIALPSICASVGGEWTRVVNIDISVGGNCPSGWRKATQSGVSFCRGDGDASNICYSSSFSTNGMSYHRVCGRAKGYQKGGTSGFSGYHNGQTIDQAYSDALSITYGNSPRQHIWTYAVGHYDNSDFNFLNCPCGNGGFEAPPFVEPHYYCESGATNSVSASNYFFDDPLWDRSGCVTSSCCDSTNQPWFYRELNSTITSDIEARLCSADGFPNAGVLIEELELYIQ